MWGRPARTFVDLSVSVPLAGSLDFSVPRDFLMSDGAREGLGMEEEAVDDVDDARDFIGGGEFMVIVSSCSSATLTASSASLAAADTISSSSSSSSCAGSSFIEERSDDDSV